MTQISVDKRCEYCGGLVEITMADVQRFLKFYIDVMRSQRGHKELQPAVMLREDRKSEFGDAGHSEA